MIERKIILEDENLSGISGGFSESQLTPDELATYKQLKEEWLYWERRAMEDKKYDAYAENAMNQFSYFYNAMTKKYG